MNNLTISIITPTFNRAYILPKLYFSLNNQTSKNFKWIVVDDGSSDGTGDLVKAWMKDLKGYEIIYRYKDNGGKHRAINYAMKFVETEFIFIVDSDDSLVPEAIQKITYWIKSINGKNDFAGVAGLRGFDTNNKIGDYPKISGHYIDASNFERRKLHLTGDKAEIYRSDLMRKYPFPEFNGEKFVTEGIVWNQIALDGYKIRWFDEIIYLGNYLEDGLTKSLEKLRRDNIQGYIEEIRVEFRISGLYKYWVLGRSIEVFFDVSMNEKQIINELQISKIQFIIGKIVNKVQHIYDYIK